MCEFCPRYGRCSVCDHYTHPLTPAKPETLKPPSSEGYPVIMDGVTVRFLDQHDALTCISMCPRARLVH